MTEIKKVNKSMGNVPNLRFKGFEGEWERIKLGELLEFKNGINAPKEQYGKGIKFVNVSDILNNDFLTYDNIAGFIDIDNPTLSKYSVEYGDILFQRSSETKEEVGTANVYLDKYNKAVFGGFVIRGKKKAEYNPIFLHNLLKSTTARNSITSRSGGSTRYNVGQDTLSSVQLCFPSITEQEKIGGLLSLIDERIATQNKIIEELKFLKNTLSKKIFSRKVGFKGKGNDFQEWENNKLKNIVHIQMGQSPDSSTYNIENIGIPLIQGNADILNRKSNPRQYTSKPTKLCEVGNVLLTVRAPVGYVAKSLHDACIGRGICVLKNKENSDMEFVYQFLIYFENSWRSLEQGSTFTAVNSSDIGLVNVSLPSIPEQVKIANFLSAIDTKIDTEAQLLQKLEVQKKYFLANLFI